MSYILYKQLQQETNKKKSRTRSPVFFSVTMKLLIYLILLGYIKQFDTVKKVDSSCVLSTIKSLFAI